MDLVENDVDILHEEIKYLVDHLVRNDVDALHEERIHLVGFSFIIVIDNITFGLYNNKAFGWCRFICMAIASKKIVILLLLFMIYYLLNSHRIVHKILFLVNPNYIQHIK
jgi:hypothetical protein